MFSRKVSTSLIISFLVLPCGVASAIEPQRYHAPAARDEIGEWTASVEWEGIVYPPDSNVNWLEQSIENFDPQVPQSPESLLLSMVQAQRRKDLDGVKALFLSTPSQQAFAEQWFGDLKPSFQDVDVDLRYRIDGAGVTNITFRTSWVSRIDHGSVSAGDHMGITYHWYMRKTSLSGWRRVQLKTGEIPVLNAIMRFLPWRDAMAANSIVAATLPPVIAETAEAPVTRIRARFRKANNAEERFVEQTLIAMRQAEPAAILRVTHPSYHGDLADYLSSDQAGPMLNRLLKNAPLEDEYTTEVLDAGDMRFLFVIPLSPTDDDGVMVLRAKPKSRGLGLIDRPTSPDQLMLYHLVGGALQDGAAANRVFADYLKYHERSEF